MKKNLITLLNFAPKINNYFSHNEKLNQTLMNLKLGCKFTF